MSTFCPYLWRDFYIDRDGAVYACCSHGPWLYGNIHDLTLAQIARSRALVEARTLSLSGELGCYSECTLLTKEERSSLGDVVDAGPEVMTRLHVLFGEFCNIACRMCTQKHSNRASLSSKVLEASLDLPFLATIDIQGGEPLAIKEAVQFFGQMAKRGVSMGVMTNGMPITEEWAYKLALHCHRVCISINGATPETHELVNRGSSWNRVMRNIDRLFQAKATVGSSITIAVHFTMVDENIDEVPRFIDEMGARFSEISLGFDRSVPDLLKAQPQRRTRVRRALQASKGVHALPPDSRARLVYLGLLGEQH